MIYTTLTKKAMSIAYQAHKNYVDKGGVPYIYHPIHLAEQMVDEDTVIVALLHDVIEDSKLTMDDLNKQGFSDNVMEAIEILTRVRKEDYFSYINKIKSSTNPCVKNVKLADLRHNSDMTRLWNINKRVVVKNGKYKKAIAILEEMED